MKDDPLYYVIIRGHSHSSLSEEVNKYITKGYIPHGSIVVVPNKYGGGVTLYQPMIWARMK